MASQNVPLHVFLSYSRDDELCAGRIQTDLEQQGFPIWVDTKRLVPGTPNWERSIRWALQHAYSVVLVATPSSRDSSFVQAELALAQSLGLPMVPVWASGDAWIQSVPLAAAQTQYIDLRQARFESGIAQLAIRLRELMVARKPRQVLVNDAHAGWYDASEVSLGSGIPSYLTVQLDWPPHEKPREARQRDERAVLVDPEAYPSVQALLDELYVGHLRELIPPGTYGARWVLQERGASLNPSRIAVPWRWLLCEDAVTSYEPFWARSPLKEHSLVAGSVWIVRELDKADRHGHHLRPTAYGLAVNSDALLQEIMTGPGKQPLWTIDAGFLEKAPLTTIEMGIYRHLLVVTDPWAYTGHLRGHALREADKPFSLEETTDERKFLARFGLIR
jgi:hypothetical protein